MSRRAVPYPPPGATVNVPEPLWTDALGELRRYGTLGREDRRRGSEGLVYLGGLVADGELVVTSLLCIGHMPQGDRVVVTAAEAKWLVRTLRERDEKLIGQIHTHRGAAGHSLGDDLHATSFHDGFISIVVPRFGRDTTELGQCAVLEYREGTFSELAPADVAARILVAPQVVRRTAAPPAHSDIEERPWMRFARRAKSIAHRRLWPPAA